MARRPNFVFLLSDQQHRDALSCMGDFGVDTPVLDALAGKGLLFRRAYSNNPVCGPYRGTLLTGQYSSRSGMTRNGDALPDGVSTFADIFNDAGYRTSWVGKWHLGGKGNELVSRDLQGGFQRFNGYQCYNSFTEGIVFHDHHERTREYTGHRTTVTTDLALDELRHLAAQDEPFLLFVSYQAPHYPVQPAAPYAEAYATRPVWHRPNCELDTDPYTGTASPSSPRPRELDPDFQRYGNDLDEYIRLYNAMCTQVDDQVGRLLTEMQALSINDSTVVLYTSDHGDMQGSHGLKNKRYPYEESAGVPFILHGPGYAMGVCIDHEVCGMDVLHTFAELADIPVPDDKDGRSLMPYLLGTPEADNPPVFSESKDWRMVVQGGWKLVAQLADEKLSPLQLFDLNSDPYEMTNLVEDSSHADLQQDLLNKLRAWLADVA